MATGANFITKNNMQIGSNLTVGTYSQGQSNDLPGNNGILLSGNVGIGTSVINPGDGITLSSGNLNITSAGSGILYSDGSFQTTASSSSGSGSNSLNVIDYQVFTTSGTWIKPANVSANGLVYIMMWGGGGGGSVTTVYGGGGGGGACVYGYFLANKLTANVTVTVGSGGFVSAGGNSQFGTASDGIFFANLAGTLTYLNTIIAYGGGGCSTNGTNGRAGGGGGGWGGVGQSGSVSAISNGGDGGPSYGGATTNVTGGTGAGNTISTSLLAYFGGGAGAGVSSASGANAGISKYGGGGGGGGLGSAGGNSLYGGGGGATNSASGGSSVYGGTGANTLTLATAPGGGGAGNAGSSAYATGARGEVRIWTLG